MSNRLRHARQIPLSCERLEDRLPLAGNITATVSGNTLKLTGDVEANVLTIQADAADETKFTVSSSTGTINTTIAQGTDFSTPTGVKNITIDLREGDDRVIFGNDVKPIVVQGNVTIKGGAGANDVVGTDLTVQKNLSITNGANPAGSDDSEFINLNVGGSVTVKNGDGDSDTEFFRNSAGDSTIGGNLSVTNGVGVDYFYLIDTNVSGNVTVKNGKMAANGVAGETEIYNDQNTTARSTIGGNVSVSYTDGHGTGGEEDGIWDTEVFGNVTFNHGSGAFRTDFDGYSVDQPVVIRGNLALKGTGAQTVVTGDVYFAKGLIVGKNFDLSAGALEDVVRLDKLAVTGKANFKLGDGPNSLTVPAGGDTTVEKSWTITGGKDVDTIRFDARVNTPKLTVTLKDGSDVFNSTVGLFGNAAGTLRTAVSADLGKGNDNANIDTIFASLVTFKLGDGFNGLTVAHPNVVKATVDGGKDADTVAASDGNIDTIIAKLFGGSDLLTATNLVIATSVNIDMGADVDTLTVLGVLFPVDPAKIKIKNNP